MGWKHPDAEEPDQWRATLTGLMKWFRDGAEVDLLDDLMPDDVNDLKGTLMLATAEYLALITAVSTQVGMPVDRTMQLLELTSLETNRVVFGDE